MTIEQGEACKTIAFYQILANEFRVTPADCIPLVLPRLRTLNLRTNELKVYLMLIDKLRFLLPMVVTEIPYIHTSVAGLASALHLLEDDVICSIRNLSDMRLIEYSYTDGKLSVCILDVNQSRKG